MATLKNINSPVWGLSVVGYGVIVEGIAAIRQRMDLAIRTTRGTDPLRPEFGSYVFEFVDMPVNVAIPNIKLEIIRALQMWVPEVKVIAIKHELQTPSNPVFEITYRLTDEELVDKLLMDIREGVQTSVEDAANEIILQAFFPDNPNGYNYKIKLVRNGAEVFPKANPAGFATLPELFQWVQANWFFVGKWYMLSDRIVVYMNGTGIKSASLSIDTLPITIFSADIPKILSKTQVYKVDFKANGETVLPLLPQIYTGAGELLDWVKDNWTNYDWSIEFLTSSGYGVFTDEFSEEFLVDATGYKLTGASNQKDFVAEFGIITVEANLFSAVLPALDPGEVFVVSFLKDGIPVNPNAPNTSNPEDVLNHARKYWGEFTEWEISEGSLVGLGHTSFDALLTITKA